MTRHSLGWLLVLLAAVVTPGLASAGREVTVAECVAAQEAIERIYYAHQTGATRPFEEAVPREVIESKVRTYLEESAALERIWKAAVTREALQAEMERIVANTRFPDRLLEVYRALGEDPVLVYECFARPVLVDRLIRQRFAFDAGIHAAAQAEAQALRERLQAGDLADPVVAAAGTVVEILRSAAGEVGDPGTVGERIRRPAGDPVALRLPSEEFERMRAEAPSRLGEVGPVVEEVDRFVIRIALSAEADRARIAAYTVPKLRWDGWWEKARQAFRGAGAAAVGEPWRSLPRPRGGESVAASPLVPASRGFTAESLLSCQPDDTWTPTSTVNAPPGRQFPTAVWTGNLMVVWGGVNFNLPSGSREINTGGRYDPLTDAWTPTSLEGAPAGRFAHATVWTGSRMIVWGGSGRYNNLNTGGRYDPIADTWAPTSMVDAPPPVFLSPAVWTGRWMVVWGSYEQPIPFGGRYDPVGDRWLPVTTTNAPPWAGFGHTKIWTGTEMIVWSGSPDSDGAYDPVADAWRQISPVNAPHYRQFHTAVWSGSEMIIWGADPRGGGRYDPLADSWTPVSRTNEPSYREGHIAVWTGSRMIVWGGSTFDGNTGGRYDPVTDSWAATSTVGAPARRADQAAVWTGSFMIVWGGYPAANTGGRYALGQMDDRDLDGFSPCTGDCDDYDPASHPGSEEICDARDNDCDGVADEGFDADLDLVADCRDNCPDVANAGQDDLDWDLIGDACDPCTFVVSCPAAVTIECQGPAGALVSLPPAVASSTCDPSPIVTNSHTPGGADASGTYPPGATTVAVTATDTTGATATCTSRVIVHDTLTVSCPASVTAECQGPDGAHVSLPPAVATSSCDPSPAVTNSYTAGGPDASGTYLLGYSTDVRVTATDITGATASCYFQVTVQDTIPPAISVSAAPAVLWPPNHRMVPVNLTVTAEDVCDPNPVVVLESVVSSEPDDAPGEGDGHTTGDIQDAALGSLDTAIVLRAERGNDGAGRLYTVTYTTRDSWWRTASAAVSLAVPRTLGGQVEPIALTVTGPENPPDGAITLSWSPVPDGLAYNVIRGTVSAIQGVGSFTNLGEVLCVGRDLTDTTIAEPAFHDGPSPGEAYFYLVEYLDPIPSGYASVSGGGEIAIPSGDTCH